ncbi:nuclear receptor ROR-beta-like [Mya arenaria]|uniref:nuclear receptor ROR-beta-like n=1 Tax=Mya arenaria TaxID=6604 RepID=UPI0022E1F911|nr:nuclear receptor ROR-beta-like [Mya arenaria]
MASEACEVIEENEVVEETELVEETIADSPSTQYGVDVIEIVYPPTPDLTPGSADSAESISSPDVGTDCVPLPKSKTIRRKKKHFIVPNEVESPGLVLLSHLCELSSKNAKIQELALSGAAFQSVSSANVQVQYIPQLNEAEVATPSCITIEPAIVSAEDSEFNNAASPSAPSMYTVVENVPYDINITTEEESQSPTDKTKKKSGSRVTKSLKFPPCFVCGGNASGSHYGVNSCEACKGFFRRYLLRSEEYKCNKGGNCEIINRNRGNCSGCRLQKCLALGMAKEKSKLGRYTLAKRTATIKEVNKLEGKGDFECVREGHVLSALANMSNMSSNDGNRNAFNSKGERVTEKAGTVDMQALVSDDVISVLIQKVHELQPYGPNVNTQEEVEVASRNHYESYLKKVELFGAMKAVPKEEYFKVYSEHGIDLDGRMGDLKSCGRHIDRVIEKYCEFARTVPQFSSLSTQDQSSLLKISRTDWFMVIMHQGYRRKYNTFINYDGTVKHFDEAVDKFLSRSLLVNMLKIFTKLQDLNLCEEEMVLLASLVMLSPDRCQLENQTLVEDLQVNIFRGLQREFKRRHPDGGFRRLTKAIDCVIEMREVSDVYLQEYNELCKEKVLLEEMPLLAEFIVDNV